MVDAIQRMANYAVSHYGNNEWLSQLLRTLQTLERQVRSIVREVRVNSESATLRYNVSASATKIRFCPVSTAV